MGGGGGGAVSIGGDIRIIGSPSTVGDMIRAVFGVINLVMFSQGGAGGVLHKKSERWSLEDSH